MGTWTTLIMKSQPTRAGMRPGSISAGMVKASLHTDPILKTDPTWRPTLTGRIGTQSLIMRSLQTRDGMRPGSIRDGTGKASLHTGPTPRTDPTWRPTPTGRIGTRSLIMRSPQTRNGMKQKLTRDPRHGLCLHGRMIGTRTVSPTECSTPPSAPTEGLLIKVGSPVLSVVLVQRRTKP